MNHVKHDPVGNDESIWHFLESFFSRKLYLTLYFLIITESFSLDTSGRTISLITSICSSFCWEKLDAILHHRQQTLWECIFFDEICSSITTLILLSHDPSIRFYFRMTFCSFSSLTYRFDFPVFCWMWIFRHLLLCFQLSLLEKCPSTEFFLVRIFPYLEWVFSDIQQFYSVM